MPPVSLLHTQHLVAQATLPALGASAHVLHVATDRNEVFDAIAAFLGIIRWFIRNLTLFYVDK